MLFRVDEVTLRDALFHQRNLQAGLQIVDRRTRQPYEARELTVAIGRECLLDVMNDLACGVVDLLAQFVIAVEPFTSRQLPHVRPQLIGQLPDLQTLGRTRATHARRV